MKHHHPLLGVVPALLLSSAAVAQAGTPCLTNPGCRADFEDHHLCWAVDAQCVLRPGSYRWTEGVPTQIGLPTVGIIDACGLSPCQPPPCETYTTSREVGVRFCWQIDGGIEFEVGGQATCPVGVRVDMGREARWCVDTRSTVTAAATVCAFPGTRVKALLQHEAVPITITANKDYFVRASYTWDPSEASFWDGTAFACQVTPARTSFCRTFFCGSMSVEITDQATMHTLTAADEPCPTLATGVDRRFRWTHREEPSCEHLEPGVMRH